MKKSAIRIFKLLLLVSGSLLLLVLVYFLSALLLSAVTLNKNHVASNDITIWIRSNGVHADIVAPLKTEIIDWSQTVNFSDTYGNDTTAKWVAFGWGDKGFYLQTPTWADLKFSVAFNAISGLSEAAMHVTFYNNLNVDEDCIPYKISKIEYRELVNFIASGFDKNISGEVIHIVTDANYNDHDAFYEAKGTYSLFYTCNTWTNNALKYAGLPSCAWTPFERGVMEKYR